MKLRMRHDVRGTFLGHLIRDGDCISVYRGDVIDCPELLALQLIMNGQAETKLDGPFAARAWEKPPPRELAKLRAEIAALRTPHLFDQVREQMQQRRKSGRAATPAELEAERRAINL